MDAFNVSCNVFLCISSFSSSLISLYVRLVCLDTPSADRLTYTGNWRLNKAVVKDEAQLDYWYPHPDPTATEEQIVNDPTAHVRIVTAESRTDESLCGCKRENCILLGLASSYKTPKINGTLNGQSVTVSTNGGQHSGQRRVRNGSSSLTPHQKILILADCFPGVSTSFCLILTGANTLYNSCGQSASSKDIRLGGYEPEISTRRLGNLTPIFVEWNRIIILKRNINVPEKTIKMSPLPNQTINFSKSGLSLTFSAASILSGGKVKCFGTTCDRQDPSCPGCHIGSAPRRNFVVQVIVEIENQFEYNTRTGVAAFTFRSFALTELFLNIDTVQNLDYEMLRHFDIPLRRAVRAIQNHVNLNGGWTVYGWHRRGQVAALEDGALEINATTVGHLSRVEPTDSTQGLLDAIAPLRFKIPT